jgi:hypothetical protein
LPPASSPSQRWRCAGFIKPATPLILQTAKCPEPLCPTSVLPPLGRRNFHLLRGRYPPVLAPTGSCATPLGLSPPSAFSLVWRVLAGCTQPLLPHGSFPTLSLKIFPWMLDPVPRRSHRVLLPVSSPMSSAFPQRRWGRLPALIRESRLLAGPCFRGLQIFLNVPASKFARPPDRPYRCAYCHRAAGAFTSGHIVLRYLHTHRIC